MLCGFLVDCDRACCAAFAARAWVYVLVCGFGEFASWVIEVYVIACSICFGMAYVRVVR